MMFEKYKERKKQREELKNNQKEEKNKLEKIMSEFDNNLILFPGNKSEFEECFNIPIDIVDTHYNDKFVSRFRCISPSITSFYFGREEYILPLTSEYNPAKNKRADEFLLNEKVIALIHYMPYEGAAHIREGVGVPVKRKS